MIVGISGASGVIYGVQLLRTLHDLGVESHLVMSKSAEITLAYETDIKVAAVHDLADFVYPMDPDMKAPAVPAEAIAIK